MEVPEHAAAPGSSSLPTDALSGFRQLKVAIFVGLLGQALIWGSAIALWIVGSIYSNVPISKKIAYGANGFSVSAGAIFDLNYLLIAGAAVALISLALATRGFQKVAKAPPSFSIDAVAALTTIGTVGFGMFAVGWAIWLGSFVAPGVGANADPSAYAPVLSSNIADVVNLLLIVGGLLAFLGMLGIVGGSSKVGTTYDAGAVELGGGLSILPVFSIVGHVLILVGLVRGERKLERGWVPPPPPPTPTYPQVINPAGYPGRTPIVVAGQPGSWDSLAVVLVACLILLWILVLPFTLFLASGGLRYGPAGPPGGGNGSSPPSASESSTPVLPILFVALVATALLLPIAIVRNRRKRQRSATQAVPPPQPPPPPPPQPAREDDPLDHLV